MVTCFAANYAVLNGVPIIVFWFLLGSRYQELQALQHECVHGNAFSSPWLNTMLGYLAAFINIFPNYWYVFLLRVNLNC
jgi:fatty acid desaturase